MANSPWSNQRVDLIILQEAVSGFSGLFGYSPSIGAGNLIFSLAAAAGIDPYENAYPAGLSVTGADSVLTGADYVINANGQFFYSGTPAAGNLIASIASGSGTDNYGNAYLAGPANYWHSGGIWHAVSLYEGAVRWWSAPGYGGPWTQEIALLLDFAANQLDVIIASTTVMEVVTSGVQMQKLLTLIEGLTVNGGATTDTLDVTTSATIAAAAAIPAIEPGTTSTPESWHSMTPYLASGVSAVSGWQPPSFRLNVLGDIDIEATLSFTSGGTGNDNLATLPAGYHGSDGLIFIPCAIITFPGSSGVHAGYATLASNGNLNVHGITASGTAEVVLGTGGTLSLG